MWDELNQKQRNIKKRQRGLRLLEVVLLAGLPGVSPGIEQALISFCIFARSPGPVSNNE